MKKSRFKIFWLTVLGILLPVCAGFLSAGEPIRTPQLMSAEGRVKSCITWLGWEKDENGRVSWGWEITTFIIWPGLKNDEDLAGNYELSAPVAFPPSVPPVSSLPEPEKKSSSFPSLIKHISLSLASAENFSDWSDEPYPQAYPPSSPLTEKCWPLNRCGRGQYTGLESARKEALAALRVMEAGFAGVRFRVAFAADYLASPPAPPAGLRICSDIEPSRGDPSPGKINLPGGKK